MLDSIFISRVVLSFFVAGIWITFATFLAEKLGSKLGGLFGNLPSNIVISLLFITITQDVNTVREATQAVPISLMIDKIFLLLFILIIGRNYLLAVLGGLSAWFLLAWFANELQFTNWILTIPFYLFVTAIVFFVVEKFLNIPSQPKKIVSHPKYQYFIRAFFAGTVVATSVVIAKIAGPYWGGLFSAFPASLLSSLTILYFAQGVNFARATGKILILSTLNNAFYALSVFITYSRYGIVVGTIISYLVATCVVISLMPLLKKIK
ncbi:MAG: DUF3147 family protein [Candidatus Gracilibacteria bacterium]|jgi:hypothetical protein